MAAPTDRMKQTSDSHVIPQGDFFYQIMYHSERNYQVASTHSFWHWILINLRSPCVVHSTVTFTPRKVLVIPRKQWLCPDMTEKLFTGMLSFNKTRTKHYGQLRVKDCINFRKKYWVSGTIHWQEYNTNRLT